MTNVGLSQILNVETRKQLWVIKILACRCCFDEIIKVLSDFRSKVEGGRVSASKVL